MEHVAESDVLQLRGRHLDDDLELICYFQKRSHEMKEMSAEGFHLRRRRGRVSRAAKFTNARLASLRLLWPSERSNVNGSRVTAVMKEKRRSVVAAQ